jgi:hypothetical protein
MSRNFFNKEKGDEYVEIDINRSENNNGFSCWMEKATKVDGSKKKVDILVICQPVGDIDDVKWHDCTILKSNNVLLMKAPKQRSSDLNTDAMYRDKRDHESGKADDHKAYATRMKKSMRDGDEAAHVKLTKIRLPFKVSNKYGNEKLKNRELKNGNSDDDDDDAYFPLAREVNTTWKWFNKVELKKMPVVSVLYRVSIDHTLEDLKIEVEIDQITDDMKQLMAAAKNDEIIEDSNGG